MSICQTADIVTLSVSFRYVKHQRGGDYCNGSFLVLYMSILEDIGAYNTLLFVPVEGLGVFQAPYQEEVIYYGNYFNFVSSS